MMLLNDRLTSKEIDQLVDGLIVDQLPSVAVSRVRAVLDKRDRIACLYFVLLDGKIVYIGETWNLRARWGTRHKIRRMPECANARIACLRTQLRFHRTLIEKAFVLRYRPVLNAQTYALCNQLQS